VLSALSEERAFATFDGSEPDPTGDFLTGDVPTLRPDIAGSGGGILNVPAPLLVSTAQVTVRAVSGDAFEAGSFGPEEQGTYNLSVPSIGLQWDPVTRLMVDCGGPAYYCPGRFIPLNAVLVSQGFYSTPLQALPNQRYN